MKVLKYIQGSIALLAVLFFVSGNVQAQSKAEKKKAQFEAVSQLLAEKNFIFRANTAVPQYGGVVQLTSRYDVRVKGDSVVSDLPYFGRAFVAPMDPTRGGIQFTSTDNDLTVTPQKRGGWEVHIKPKDTREVQQMFLSVSESGYASLRVTSTNRQSISFSGTVEKAKERSR